jgi:monoamine oxidase
MPQTGQAQSATAARTQTNPAYETLIEPDGQIVFAGDHVSHIVAWQEGAALSALRAVQQVADRVKAAKVANGASNVIRA